MTDFNKHSTDSEISAMPTNETDGTVFFCEDGLPVVKGRRVVTSEDVYRMDDLFEMLHD